MRSLLLIAPDEAHALAAPGIGKADGLILALTIKSASDSRKTTCDALLALRDRMPGLPLFVRIADLQTPGIDADLDMIMQGRPDAIVLSQARNGADIQHLSVKLSVREAELGLADGTTKILAIVAADPAAIFDMGSFVDKSPRLAGMIFGAGDLAAAIGAAPYGVADEALSAPLGLARSFTLLAAKAAGVPAIDAASPANLDEARLRAACAAAKRDGFFGKLARDAHQAAVIDAVFAER
ncbi:MAG: aldolase/citrate lyase family protein [Methylovirgula sp.]